MRYPWRYQRPSYSRFISRCRAGDSTGVERLTFHAALSRHGVASIVSEERDITHDSHATKGEGINHAQKLRVTVVFVVKSKKSKKHSK